MNDTSSHQRPAVSFPLTPTDSALKQQWTRKPLPFPYSEYRLNGIPESLNAFVDQFVMEDGGYDKNLLIWTAENSFVTLGEDWQHQTRLPRAYRNDRFQLRLTSASSCLLLSTYCTTLEDAMLCFDFLIGLHDDHFEKMSFSYNSISGGRGYPLCPLTSVLLEKILHQNAKRKHVFRDMTFTPDQSRTLATSGTRTDMELIRCNFEDDGAAFLEALAAREDPQTGLAKLSIWGGLPFAEGILVLFLHMLECLTIYRIRLESEEASRAVAEAELQYLDLRYCKLGDGGASLVESIREGRGPKGLGLHKRDDDEDDWLPFDSSERFVSFIDALRSNSNLERLDLSDFNFREEGICDALAAALFENIGLAYLGLLNCRFDGSGFCKLLRAISAHPSLRMLDLTDIFFDMDATDATKEVAKMLSDNYQLEEIRIDEDDDDSPFDSMAWDSFVIPRLECNVYRKWFPAIQNIRSPSTRAAVMARALSHANDKPSPAFSSCARMLTFLHVYS
jgi:hypothetical protein